MFKDLYGLLMPYDMPCAHTKSYLVQVCSAAFDATLHTPRACKKAPNESTEGGFWSEGMYWAALDGMFHMIVGTRYSKLCSVLLKLLVLGNTPLCVAC